MTKAELVADLLAKGADESEITQIKNTSEKELVEAGLIEGKQTDVASKGADVTSENTAPESTESDLESTSSASPSLLIDIGEDTYTLEEATVLAGEEPVSSYVKKNNGQVRLTEDHTLPEVKVTPIYESTNARADELFQEELDNIFRVYEGTSISQLNIKKKTKEFGGEVEANEDEESLWEHITNPLTGLEDVKDGYKVVGVKRANTNSKGNQSLTSSELKLAATNIWEKLRSENKYIGSVEEGSFNYKVKEKTKKELNNWAIQYQTELDWNDPMALNKFAEAYRSKVDEVWSREAANDEEYQYNYSLIENILNDKFKPLIINKGIEEGRSALIPDEWENAGALAEGLYKFFKYVLPSARTDSRVVSNGDALYQTSQNFDLAVKENWKDDTEGYLGKDSKGLLVFKVQKKGTFPVAAGMGGGKKMSWKKARGIINDQIDQYGYTIMENLAKSREYQEKLSVLGSPEILDENWNWNLDGQGYKELLGTQLGQMALGALSFGGSTFMQELGQMSQQLILEKSVMMMEGIPMDGSIANFNEKEVKHLMNKFNKLSTEEQNALALKVLKGGHIPFDTLYNSAARSAGLDLVGNWFVISKGAKLVPKQLVNGFMTKNLNMFLKGGGNLLTTLGTGTLAEMLTEGLQATNSEATVAMNSPLSNFDYHPVINEGLMAAVVPGPVILAGMTTSSIIQNIREKQLDAQEGSYTNWLKVAKEKINSSNLSNEEKTAQYEKIFKVEEILSNTNLKDVKTPGQRGRVIAKLLDSQTHQTRINELQAEIDKRKELGESVKTTDLDKEIALLTEKISRNQDIIIQEKTVDNFLVNAERQAEWQNRQSEGIHKNRFTKIFQTREEALNYLLKNYPAQLGQFKNMLEGGYGTNVQVIGADGEVIAYNFAIQEHVISGIRNGDLMAGNVINHEHAHDNLSTFSDQELESIRANVLSEMEASNDPQMKRALILMKAKLRTYDGKKGVRNQHEEFFTSMSDAFHYLNMENLSIEGSTTLSLLGEIFSGSFNENVGPIVDWKTAFNDMGVVDFIKSYTKDQTRIEEVNPIETLRGGKEPGVFDDDVTKGSDGIYVKDSRRVYPLGRTEDEIKQANSVLAEEIRNEKANPSYTNEKNPALEAKIREDQLQKLHGELVANNMGLVNMFLKHKSSGGFYFDPKAGDVDYTDFSEAVMGEVGIIINSYDETKGDFGMYLGSLMDKRIPGIWQKLVRAKEVKRDDDSQPVPDEGGMDSFMTDFEDEIITIGGKETTKKAATSEMRKRLGIKTGDPMYNEILDDVIEITIQNYDAINEEGFYQDTKERFQKALFTKIKKGLGSPKSEKFITWLNDNVEDIYNLLPQSVFNKSYDQFNDIVSGRATVAQSEDKDFEFEKGVKVKSKTAGNRVAVKKPFTPEIGEQFINAILNPEKGRPASKQDGLVNNLIEVIAFDAVGTAMNSSAFKSAYGDQDAIMGVIADKINRDMSVQFSTRVDGKVLKYELNSAEDLQKANMLIREIEESGIVNSEDIRGFLEKTGKDLKIKQDVINFVIHLDSKEIIEKGDAVKFKADIIKYLNETDPDLAAKLKEQGAIKGKKDILDDIAEEVKNFTGGLNPEILDAIGYDIFAFHRRVLNAAETQQGPIRGADSDGIVRKANESNMSFASNNRKASLLINGWTFDPVTNMFYHGEGKYAPSEDPVKNHGAIPTPAPYFQTLQDIKAANEIKKTDPNYSSTGKYDNVRIMNIDYSGGLFKKIGNILNDKKLNRQQKIDKIIKNHGAEIEAANKANTELATDISVSLIEAVKDGSMDETTLIHVLQSQTNLAFGFRGLTKLQMISVSEGSYKEGGSRVYGEHVKANSSKMLELAKIALKAKKDPEYNYREAVAKLFADHDQIILPSENAKTIDVSPKLSGPTSTAAYDRLKALTPAEQKNFIGINGESYKEALANANARKNIEIETAKIKFESERKIVKEKAKQNILVGEEQGSTVYDFDETLAYSDNIVKATNKKTGEVVELTSDQWKDWRGGEDFSYDFSDFNYVTNGKPGPMIPDLIKTIDKHGVDGVFVLTARHQDSAVAMRDFINGELVKHYKSKGVAMKDIPQIPLENFTGVGNSTGEAKANWIQENLILNGFNRIKFADDATFNIDAVQDMFNTWPLELLEGKTVLVQESLSVDFNKILEATEGIKAEATFSKAQGQIRGRTSGNWYDILYSPSAYDFEMFTYMYRGKGKKGEQDGLFFKEALFNPYETAIQTIDKQKQEIRNNYKALIKELPQVKKNLKKNIKGTNYTIEQAVRVYTWSKSGIEIPGLSKRDQEALIKVVEADPELIMFSDRLSALSQQEKGYTPPSDYWTVEGISYDLTEMTGQVGRAKALAKWKENVEQIFSEENKNKLRALYGNDHIEALEDILYRMEYGKNRGRPGRIEQQWNNWVNNSVGAVMFFNMRSASLQTISAFNYVDWDNNNMAKAALAFANQPQYWKDFSYIFNSDYLKERRTGSKRTINEAELTAHLRGKDNKAKAALAWLLEKGFAPTQIADSFAISAGGAGYYRNQVKFYEKQGMSIKDAEAQAFLDFRDKTEKGQQSSRADMISQQQAGGLGRLILAFKNTPMQYNRLMIKAVADLKNGRGSTKTNLSKIAYYGAVQNALFTSLQTALFSALGDEDEWDSKKERMANSMIDSILNGMGLTGAVAVTIKNGYLSYSRQKARGFRADQTRTIIEFANMSPTIGSKLRKLYTGIKGEQMNQGAIEEMGLTINNPAFNSLANVISATTNIPLDRAVNKIQNILLASKDHVEAGDKIALLLGWNPWDLGLETEAREVNVEVKERKKEEKKKQKKIEKEAERKEKEKIRKEKEAKMTRCTVHTRKGKGPRCKNLTENKNGKCYAHQ
tara:strand:- start:328 stop:8913 length:8586 start_codon:yes stop_codon:yes gene_type:complete